MTHEVGAVFLAVLLAHACPRGRDVVGHHCFLRCTSGIVVAGPSRSLELICSLSRRSFVLIVFVPLSVIFLHAGTSVCRHLGDREEMIMSETESIDGAG